MFDLKCVNILLLLFLSSFLSVFLFVNCSDSMDSLSLLLFDLVHISLHSGWHYAAADDLHDGPDHSAVCGPARTLRPPLLR